MKTGIIRRVDDLGRIVIPNEIRRRFGILEGDPLEISVEEDKICLEVYNQNLAFKDRVNRLRAQLRNNPINVKTDNFIFERLNEIIDYIDNLRK